MHTNVRLDTKDYDHVIDVCTKYAYDHTGTKYLLAKEIGDVTGKPHLQGWFYHTENRKAFRQYIYSNFSELKGGKRAVSATRNLTNEYRYITNNKTKPGFKFEDCITNYTQQEYDQIVNQISGLPPFVSKEEFVQDKAKKQTQSWWHDTIDILDKRCVYEGQILYSAIPTVFFKLPLPKRLSKAIVKENLQGMIMELERRHAGNTRLHDEYMESVVCDPLFAHSKEEMILFKQLS